MSFLIIFVKSKFFIYNYNNLFERIFYSKNDAIFKDKSIWFRTDKVCSDSHNLRPNGRAVESQKYT